MIKERQIIVHSPARRERRPPRVWVVVRDRSVAVRTCHMRSAHQAVRKEREVLHRSPEDRASGSSVQAVVLAVRMRGKDRFGTEILVKVVGATTDCSDID